MKVSLTIALGLILLQTSALATLEVPQCLGEEPNANCLLIRAVAERRLERLSALDKVGANPNSPYIQPKDLTLKNGGLWTRLLAIFGWLEDKTYLPASVYAVQSKNLKAVQQLIEQMNHPLIADSDLVKRALQEKAFDIANYLVSKGDHFDQSVLLVAIGKHQEELAISLLPKVGNLRSESLSQALRAKMTGLVKAIIDSDQKISLSEVPLALIVANKDKTLFDAAFESGSDVNQSFALNLMGDGNKIEVSPLQIAAYLGLSDILDDLLDDEDIEINAVHSGRTALHFAVLGNNLAGATALLDKGAAADGGVDCLRTPLREAIDLLDLKRARDLSELLVSRGASLAKADVDNFCYNGDYWHGALTQGKSAAKEKGQLCDDLKAQKVENRSEKTNIRKKKRTDKG